VEARLAALRGRLLDWLIGAAYPRWSRRGIDPTSGAFVERLSQDACPQPDPRRVRVQPRQVSAFAHAPALGWRGHVPGQYVLPSGWGHRRTRHRGAPTPLSGYRSKTTAYDPCRPVGRRRAGNIS
jgi:mannose/cellobiose epimerase-like protein (N-acyl-D-glucosamine 2-epimerase family)